MRQRWYKLKRFLGISHSFSGDRAAMHNHTLCIECTVKLVGDDIIEYDKIEGIIDDCLAQYENNYINDIVGFEENASIEHFGEILCYELDDKIKPYGYEMCRFEIGETPLRLYVITDELRE